MNDVHYWTYAEWVQATIDKIVAVGLSAAEGDRVAWFRVQIAAAIRQAHRHGRSGLPDDAPVTP